MIINVVLPESPVVLDRWGRQLNSTKIGPMQEAEDIILSCRVVGGKLYFCCTYLSRFFSRRLWYFCAAFKKKRMKLKQKEIRTVQEGMRRCCEFRRNSSGLKFKSRIVYDENLGKFNILIFLWKIFICFYKNNPRCIINGMCLPRTPKRKCFK